MSEETSTTPSSITRSSATFQGGAVSLPSVDKYSDSFDLSNPMICTMVGDGESSPKKRQKLSVNPLAQTRTYPSIAMKMKELRAVIDEYKSQEQVMKDFVCVVQDEINYLEASRKLMDASLCDMEEDLDQDSDISKKYLEALVKLSNTSVKSVKDSPAIIVANLFQMLNKSSMEQFLPDFIHGLENHLALALASPVTSNESEVISTSTVQIPRHGCMSFLASQKNCGYEEYEHNLIYYDTQTCRTKVWNFHTSETNEHLWFFDSYWNPSSTTADEECLKLKELGKIRSAPPIEVFGHLSEASLKLLSLKDLFILGVVYRDAEDFYVLNGIAMFVCAKKYTPDFALKDFHVCVPRTTDIEDLESIHPVLYRTVQLYLHFPDIRDHDLPWVTSIMNKLVKRFDGGKLNVRGLYFPNSLLSIRGLVEISRYGHENFQYFEKLCVECEMSENARDRLTTIFNEKTIDLCWDCRDNIYEDRSDRDDC